MADSGAGHSRRSRNRVQRAPRHSAIAPGASARRLFGWPGYGESRLRQTKDPPLRPAGYQVLAVSHATIPARHPRPEHGPGLGEAGPGRRSAAKCLKFTVLCQFNGTGRAGLRFPPSSQSEPYPSGRSATAADNHAENAHCLARPAAGLFGAGTSPQPGLTVARAGQLPGGSRSTCTALSVRSLPRRLPEARAVGLARGSLTVR